MTLRSKLQVFSKMSSKTGRSGRNSSEVTSIKCHYLQVI